MSAAAQRPYGALAAALTIEAICTRRPEGIHQRADDTHFEVRWFDNGPSGHHPSHSGWYYGDITRFSSAKWEGPYSRADLACRAGFAADPEAHDFDPGEPDGADLYTDDLDLWQELGL